MKNIISLSDILSDTSEPPEAIVEGGILLKDTMLVIIGSAKTGKTFLGMNLALSIASGTEFLGFNVRQDKKVLYLCAEGGYYPNRDRLKIMSESLDEASTSNALFHFNSNLSLDDENDYEKLLKIIEEHKPEVLILDPFIRFHGMDENSSQEINKIMRGLRQIISDYNISLVLIHHKGKNVSRGGRGSSVIDGEYDSAIYLDREGDHHKVRFDMRHVESPEDTLINFCPHSYWFNAVSKKDLDPVVNYIYNNKNTTRSSIVKEWVSNNTYSRSHCYKLIDGAINKGYVIQTSKGELDIKGEI